MCAQQSDGTESGANTKIILALVNRDGTAAAVLREAESIANSYKGTVLPLYIDKQGEDGSGVSNKQLDKLYHDVESTGHTLTVINNRDVIGSIANFVRSQAINDIVIGRPSVRFRDRFKMLFTPALHDKLVSQLPGVHLHLVTSEHINADRRRIQAQRTSPLRLSLHDFFIMVFALLLTAAIAYFLDRAGVGSPASALIYILGVTLIAVLTSGYLPGMIASIAGTLMYEYFFVRTLYSLTIDHPASYLVLGIMSAVCLGITVITSRQQVLAQKAKYREMHTQALNELSRLLLFSRSRADIVMISLNSLNRLFGRSVVLFVEGMDVYTTTPEYRESEGDLTHKEMLKPTERHIAEVAFKLNERTGNLTKNSPESDMLYIPLSASEEVRGVLGISCKKELNAEDRGFLGMLIPLISSAFERQHFSYVHKLQSNREAVNAIRRNYSMQLVKCADYSASTAAEASRLLLGSTDETIGTGRAMLRSLVNTESIRTNKLVDLISRSNASVNAVQGADVNVNLLVEKAVKDIREEYPKRRIVVQLTDNDVTLRVDAALMTTALKNVLRGSLERSDGGTPVDVDVHIQQDDVVFTISDERDQTPRKDPAAFTPEYPELRARYYDRLIEAFAGNDENARKEAFRMLLDFLRIDDDVQVSEFRSERSAIVHADDVQTGMAIAACGARAHGGSVSQRARIGGGAVTSLKVPRNQ